MFISTSPALPQPPINYFFSQFGKNFLAIISCFSFFIFNFIRVPASCAAQPLSHPFVSIILHISAKFQKSQTNPNPLIEHQPSQHQTEGCFLWTLCLLCCLLGEAGAALGLPYAESWEHLFPQS
jgi:hypothetical protein